MNLSLVNKSLLLLGRILLGMIFVESGFGKLLDFDGTAGYMAAKGMPMVPLLLVGAIAVEIGGGLSLLLGVKARLGALALFLFLIPTTLIFHKFWGLEAAESALQQIQFLKNLSIMGGLLVVVSIGAQQPGLDTLLCGCCCNRKLKDPGTTRTE